MTPGECPIADQFRQVLSDSKRLAESIHRLRRSLNVCRECECAASCRFIRDFNTQFDAALQVVMDEWNLASTL